MSLIVNPGSGGNTNFTDGSIPYASSGILTENNSRLRWDNATTTLYVNSIPWTTAGISSAFSIFTPSGTGAISRTVSARLQDFFILTDYAVCDGVTDDTLAVLRAIAAVSEGGTILCPAGKTCLVSPDAFTLGTKIVNFVCFGSGLRSGTLSRPSFKFIAATNGAYFFKYSNLTTSTASVKQSFALNGVGFDSGGFTFSDSMMVVEGVSGFRPVNCSISNGTGSALRLRIAWEAHLEGVGFFGIDASSANGVLNIDDKYNSDANLNVNNLRLHKCHFENNKGPIVFAHQTSNLDVLEVTGTKHEWGLSGVPGGGPWSVYEIRQGTRVNIHGNHFTNFKNANKYNLFAIGFSATGATYAIHDNDFSGVDASTVGLSAIGLARGDLYDNRCFSSSNVVPTISITSSEPNYVEPFKNMDNGVTALGSDNNNRFLRMGSRASAAGFAAVSCHDIQRTSGVNYVADANSKNACGTVMQSAATALTDIARIPLFLPAGAPCGLRLGIRCRSATGAGLINPQVNGSALGDQTVGATYSTLYYDIPKAVVAIMGDSGSDRFKIRTGTGNAEAVFIDEIYFIWLPLQSTSTDFGNAGATLTVGSSKNINVWNTAISADRAVALSTTNVSDGDTFRIIRTANATGAFNLNVGTGPLKAMGTAGSFCDVTYNGNTAAWMLTAYGVL